MSNNKMQPLWDVILKSVSELEKMEQNESNHLQKGVIRNLIDTQKKVLHAQLGWRKKYHSKEAVKPPKVNTKATELPTVKKAQEQKEKAAPKRLSQQQSSDIKALHLEGLKANEISDKLMIVEEKIVSYLKKLAKEKRNPKNLIYVTNGDKKGNVDND